MAAPSWGVGWRNSLRTGACHGWETARPDGRTRVALVSLGKINLETKEAKDDFPKI